MGCDHNQEHLSAYLDDELEAELRTQVESELEQCADCRGLLEMLRGVQSQVSELPKRTAPASLAGKISGAVREAPSPIRAVPPAGQSQIHWMHKLSAVAVLMLAGVLGLQIMNESSQHDMHDATPKSAMKADAMVAGMQAEEKPAAFDKSAAAPKKASPERRKMLKKPESRAPMRPGAAESMARGSKAQAKKQPADKLAKDGALKEDKFGRAAKGKVRDVGKRKSEESVMSVQAPAASTAPRALKQKDSPAAPPAPKPASADFARPLEPSAVVEKKARRRKEKRRNVAHERLNELAEAEKEAGFGDAAETAEADSAKADRAPDEQAAIGMANAPKKRPALAANPRSEVSAGGQGGVMADTKTKLDAVATAGKNKRRSTVRPDGLSLGSRGTDESDKLADAMEARLQKREFAALTRKSQAAGPAEAIVMQVADLPHAQRSILKLARAHGGKLESVHDRRSSMMRLEITLSAEQATRFQAAVKKLQLANRRRAGAKAPAAPARTRRSLDPAPMEAMEAEEIADADIVADRGVNRQALGDEDDAPARTKSNENAKTGAPKAEAFQKNAATARSPAAKRRKKAAPVTVIIRLELAPGNPVWPNK